MVEFAHLHLHSEFSLLDGVGRIPHYMEKANQTGVRHLALTDHGVMYGAMDWYKSATKAGLHPIIGMEAYLAEGRAAERERKSYHLVLLAENDAGYRNLLKLASRASLEGYYYRPRVDLEWLQECHEGIIATSACLSGPVAKNVLDNRAEIAKSLAGTLAEIFGPEHFYIEVQDHGIAQQISVNRELIPLAKALGLPLVATNDVHYLNKEDAPVQEVLICVQTNTTLNDPKRLKSDTDQLYFKTPQEMWDIFGDLPESLTNTIRIAEMCSLDLGFKGYQIPDFEPPNGLTPENYLEMLCRQGLRKLYGHDDGDVGERLAYELGVIRDMGFTTYFLVVWDFVKFAKDNGILVGPGRGSAAASIVTYALGITALDPLKYDLIFERFLNPARITMPDIDIDFADDRRAEVIEYVVKKYGDDRVAQIVTFGTMAAKGSVRDVGRAMGLPFADTDRVSKLIPSGPGVTIDSAIAKVPELRALYDSETHLRELIDSARKVEGIARHSSTHAAGVVISRDPLVQHVPLQRAGGKSEGEITTQYPMGQLEDIGLLKMDFLGLSTLTILGKAVEFARAKDPTLSIESIPLDDERSYELLRRGETVGVFQLEGGMTTRMTIDVAPTTFDDIIALMALIRPGPMEMAPDYISRKHGRTPISYMHPAMETILSETYGVALYQEQILRIANVIAGFSMAEGDGLRKAMGKKLPEDMAKYRGRFVEGCLENGTEAQLAGQIFDMIERFAGYGFNKAHSAAYAVIAAQTAFLKANYPVEFMAALLSTDIGNSERIVANVGECRRSGISVLRPDVNASGLEFTVERNEESREAVRFGLAAVKNVGEGAVRAILAARERQPGGRFADLDSFCAEVDWSVVNKRAAECLARCGALDCFGPRSSIIGRLDSAIGAGQQNQKAVAKGQIGLLGMETIVSSPSLAPGVEGSDISLKQLLAWEKEFIGLYLSDHPLNEILSSQRRNGALDVFQLADRPSGERVQFIGMITTVRRVTTKANKSMAIAVCEDLTGSVELVAFPEVFESYSAHLEPDMIVKIAGKIDRRNDQLQVILESLAIELSAPTEQRQARVVSMRLSASKDVWSDIQRMHAIDAVLSRFEGEDHIVIEVPRAAGLVRLRSRKHRVEWSEDLAEALSDVLSRDSVRIEDPVLVG